MKTRQWSTLRGKIKETNMRTPKIIWRVQPKETGRYRSFYRRGWPIARDEQDRPIAQLSCDDGYIPKLVKTGNHKPITVWVADWREKNAVIGTWHWRTLAAKATTLEEAKNCVAEFYRLHPECLPAEAE
jgi:hypothetical protein